MKLVRGVRYSGLARVSNWLFVAIVLFVVAGCQVAPPAVTVDSGVSDKLTVVTTTNIVADWVRVVGGEDVVVHSLLGENSDPHHFHPGARDAAQIASADLVFAIGLGLESLWLRDLIENAGAEEGRVIYLGDFADPIHSVDWTEDGDAHEMHEDEHGHDEDHDEDHEDADEHGHDEDHDEDHEDADEHGHDEDHDEDHEDADEHGHDEDHDEDHEDADEHGDHEGHAHGPWDPHYWMDPIRVQLVTQAIAQELSRLDPDNADDYVSRANAYNLELDALHSWILERVSEVPTERRILITSHDSLQYFEHRYGFTVIGVIMPSMSEAAETSAKHMAELADAARSREVTVVFGETTVNEELAQAIATEAGAKIALLYSGALGEAGSGADTYIGMIRTNVNLIVENLK